MNGWSWSMQKIESDKRKMHCTFESQPWERNTALVTLVNIQHNHEIHSSRKVNMQNKSGRNSHSVNSFQTPAYYSGGYRRHSFLIHPIGVLTAELKGGWFGDASQECSPKSVNRGWWHWHKFPIKKCLPLFAIPGSATELKAAFFHSLWKW